MSEPQQSHADPASGQDDLLDVLKTIALDAGKPIMGVYAQEFSVAFKPDASPLTEADTLAEALIIEWLAALYPEITIIAEESVANGHAPACGDRFFLVDPLDGSKEFIARNGEFTVNIALIEKGTPVAGVVYAPALGRIWWGKIGLGAWSGEVSDGAVTREFPISVRSTPVNGRTLVGSRSHGAEREDERLRSLGTTFLTVGSSLKFCFLAEGAADLYPRFSRTMEWDTAAGDAILRAAGGQVVDLTGAPLRYGKRDQDHDSDFANGHFWAIGDSAQRDIILKLGPEQDQKA